MAGRTWLGFLESAEKEIAKDLGLETSSQAPPIIAIGGFSGVGKDTLADGLIEEFSSRKVSLEIQSSGRIARELAEKNGYAGDDLEKYLRLVNNSTDFQNQVDRAVELETLVRALKSGGIFIGRMAPFAIGDWGVSIWLKTNPMVIAKRLCSDKARPEYGLPVDTIYKKVVERDKLDRRRLEKLYDIEMETMYSRVDLMIDTEFLSKKGVVAVALRVAYSKLQERLPENFHI